MQHNNEILCGRNEDVLAGFPADCIDLTVTSPPYDNLRSYRGYTWSFDATARELWRVTKPGGVVVWVVADATVDGSESGTSFRQALAFMAMGFRLHDTMIYERINPAPQNQDRYEQAFEYQFVFSKNRPSTFNPIKVPCTYAGLNTRPNYYNADGSMKPLTGEGVIKSDKPKTNVWRYLVGSNGTGLGTGEHPASFPEKLAEDHILSWSNPGDLILDPFVGSGTTPKMAIKHHRRFIGIDISPEYCQLARRRISGVQETLFALEALCPSTPTADTSTSDKPTS